MRTFILSSAIVFSGMLLAGSAGARTFVVTTSADSHDVSPGDGICADGLGQCSLRAAIEEANTASGDTVIVGDSVSPVFLTLGELNVIGPEITIAGATSPVVIDGRFNLPGADNIVVRGGQFRIYNCVVTHARRNGLIIAARDATIGRANYSTIIAGNGAGDLHSAGIAVIGKDAKGTSIVATWVGISGNGTAIEPNQIGIRVSRADSIVIGGSLQTERNLISGNDGYGIVIDSGSSAVKVIGNYIGLEVTGRIATPNGSDGIRLTGQANRNYVGGINSNERNLISANGGCGIRIEGSGTDSNLIGGNLIGLDSAGYIMLGNQLAGIRVAGGASHNVIGRDSAEIGMHLIVSGNFQNGIEIVGKGTDSNAIDWSWVGLDGRGDGDRPNGLEQGQGVLIAEGAQYNVIGQESAIVRNVISGNYGPGVTIAGQGTNFNLIAGNYIGPSRQGTGAIGNSAGVVIRDSAQFNQIGTATYGNLLSGNRWELFPLGAGVVIYGKHTDYNTVQNNFIGVDYTGTRSVRNGSAGIILGDGASHNLIGGGTSAGNLISANGSSPFMSSLAAGIHLFGPGTDSNVISGNLIGVAADGKTPLPNAGHGIGIFSDARWTTVGGTSSSMGNKIGDNKYAGVWIDGDSTFGEVVRCNSMFDNDSIGIALRHGGNKKVVAPQMSMVVADTVYGSHPVSGAVIDIYKAKTGKNGHVEGVEFIASGMTDSVGSFVLAVAGLVTGDTITAVATVDGAGSSEFSSAIPMPVPTNVTDPGELLPKSLTLSQNYPNPFNPSTVIVFELPSPQHVSLVVFNVTGERVTTLVDQSLTAGWQSAVWNGRNAAGDAVASGVYFYRLNAGGTNIVRKMLLLK